MRELREQLLGIIEKNSRIDLKELAVILGVEEVDVVNELAAMESEGIICGYHTLIDWDKTSLDKISALIEVRVTPQRGQGFDNIAERVYKYPEVNAVYLISGGFDLLVTLEGRNLKEISSFVSEKLSALDGVFNHVGRGFWAFKDVQEKKWDSPYKDWFHISFDGNSCYDDGFWYEGWEGHFELVKLNLQNPAVVDYLMECVKYWIDEFDIDGLRLDVAYSLDHNFMRRLRSYTQELKPDFALIGEVLFGDYNIIVNDEMLHSCTNYECYKGLYSSFNCMNMFEIAHSLHRQFGSDQWCIYRGKHLMTFVDNHDVTRLASILTNKKHIPLAYGLLMGMPGIPCLYYGSEWAEPGEKAPDNDYALRPCFDEPKPNELTEFIKKLIRVRQESDALCNGAYKNVVIQNHQLVFERCSEKERVIVAINAADYPYTANAGELNGTAADLLTGETVTMNGQLELKPYSVQYLKF